MSCFQRDEIMTGYKIDSQETAVTIFWRFLDFTSLVYYLTPVVLFVNTSVMLFFLC